MRDVYMCNYCGETFDAEAESIEHEKNCYKNPTRYLEWVSVKERPPKESGSYLVSLYQELDGEESCCVLAAWYNADNFGYEDKGWTLLNEFYDLTPQLREFITHWMPYPEPMRMEE